MSFAISAIVVGGAGLAYGVYNGVQTSNAMNDQMKQQADFQQKELKQASDQQKNTTASNDANQQRNSSEQVLAAMGLGKQGWAGTLLTSPLGVPGNNTGGTSGGKTILGA